MSNLATVCIGGHTSIHLGYLITGGNPETKAFRILMGTVNHCIEWVAVGR